MSVGKDKSSLSLVDKDLKTVDVYVKFSVTLNERALVLAWMY